MLEDETFELDLTRYQANAVVYYMQAKKFEDAGDMQKSQYFRVMYDKMMKQYPSRRSGVRSLSVPRL